MWVRLCPNKTLFTKTRLSPRPQIIVPDKLSEFTQSSIASFMLPLLFLQVQSYSGFIPKDTPLNIFPKHPSIIVKNSFSVCDILPDCLSSHFFFFSCICDWFSNLGARTPLFASMASGFLALFIWQTFWCKSRQQMQWTFMALPIGTHYPFN